MITVRQQGGPFRMMHCTVTPAGMRAPRLTFADDNGLVPASANPSIQEK
jgi:hypothetical protein